MRTLLPVIHLLSVYLLMVCPTSASGQEAAVVEALVESDGERGAPVDSSEDVQPILFRIPAPRGLILDRHGEGLATTRLAKYLGMRIAPMIAHSDSGELFPVVEKALASFPELNEIVLDREKFYTHLEHRPHVVFPLTGPLSESEVSELQPAVERSDFLEFSPLFCREYPQSEALAHVIGFVRSRKPFQHGPLMEEEPLWPETVGAEGLEKVFDENLQGSSGLASYMIASSGAIVDLELLQPAVPGKIVVTTLVRPMQSLAYDILEKNGKPGAFVAVDATTGDILAMASYPSFDSEVFRDGVPHKLFEKLQSDPDKPLFPRATLGVYPPGSTIKPLVALAVLDRGTVTPWTRLPSPPYLDIDGRIFRNWNRKNEGLIDVRFALLRSSNTWFYQAGIKAGGPYLLSAYKRFGLGEAPEIDLPTAAGMLPEEKNVLANQAVANLSIGQGKTLTSPLQMALVMAGLSTGRTVPKARLVIQIQDPETNEIIDSNETESRFSMNLRRADMDSVRHGMWGVVNHKRGTGKAAQHDLPQVYGKTGTAQWKSSRNVAWFTGFVGSNAPRIAFAAMVEGGAGETLSGGRHAAPLVGQWVKEVYADREKYHVDVTVESGENPFRDPVPQPSLSTQNSGVDMSSHTRSEPVDSPTTQVRATPVNRSVPSTAAPRAGANSEAPDRIIIRKSPSAPTIQIR